MLKRNISQDLFSLSLIPPPLYFIILCQRLQFFSNVKRFPVFMINHKTREIDTKNHLFFIDFKIAYDSINRKLLVRVNEEVTSYLKS